MYCPECNREYDDKVFGDPCPNYCGKYLLSKYDDFEGYYEYIIERLIETWKQRLD